MRGFRGSAFVGGRDGGGEDEGEGGVGGKNERPTQVNWQTPLAHVQVAAACRYGAPTWCRVPVDGR